MKHVFTIDNLADDRCFLCGDQLTDAIRSPEHVFPAWLQHRVGLWNQEFTLLNETTIPYRQLTIPCCAECNNEYLGGLKRNSVPHLSKATTQFLGFIHSDCFNGAENSGMGCCLKN